MAVGFNGSNQSLTPSAAPASSSGVFTCSLWARVHDVTSRQAILGSWNWSGGGYQWVIEFGDGGTGNGFTATHYPAEFSWDVIESFVAPGSTWHHLCFVANAGLVPQFWVDGAQSNGSTASLSTVSHVDFRIGGYLGDNNYGQVDVAHVGIWNTNLGASDIAQLADRYAPDLVRRGALQNYWEFTGGLYVPKVGPVTLTAPNGASKVEAPPIILSSRPAFVAVPAAGGADSITLTGVASAEAFGTTAIEHGDQYVSLAAVPSAEAYGTTQLTGDFYLSLSAVDSAEAFGTTTVNDEANLSLDAVDSDFAAGDITLTGDFYLELDAVDSAEAYGDTTIEGAGAIALSAVDSAEAFGTTQLTESQDIALDAVDSDFAAGDITLTAEFNLLLTGVASVFAVGPIRVTDPTTPTSEPSVVLGGLLHLNDPTVMSLTVVSADGNGLPLVVDYFDAQGARLYRVTNTWSGTSLESSVRST